MGDDAAAQVQQVGLSLIKQLGSRDKKSRYKALRLLLKRWLPSQPDLTDDMMKKLWKGLFFCVWHADKHSLDIIDRLSSLLSRLHNSSLSLYYFSSFLLTMRRNWPWIDALRFEKFHLFIRRFLHYSFAFLKIHSWDLDLTSRLISLLEETCFLVKQGYSFGVSYHIASVFLEELEPFLPLQPEVLEVVFKPFISVLGSLPDKVLLRKIKRNMFHMLLKMGNNLLEVKKLGDDNHNHNDVVVLGTIALTMSFSSKFFELQSSIDCCQGNRKFLFVLYNQFLKLEKDLESSGIQVSIPIGTDMEVAEAKFEVAGVVEDVASGFELCKTKKRKRAKSEEKKRKRAKSEEKKMSRVSRKPIAEHYDYFYDPDFLRKKALRIYPPIHNKQRGQGRGRSLSIYVRMVKEKKNLSKKRKNVLPKKSGTQNSNGLFYYNGLYLSTDYFHPPFNLPPTLNEVGRNIVVALRIILSNGEDRKATIGSGAVISEDGLVLTCAHLLRDYKNREYHLSVVEVVFFNGQIYEAEAEVITEDVGKDLALLKIHASHDYGDLKLSPATLALPQEIKTGMNAYLISNPQCFSLTMTAVRYEKKLCRDLQFKNVLKLDDDTAIIQTNIVSEIGNFGGPLLNSNGEIMGVQYAKTEKFKFGIHVESILIFLEKNNVIMKKNIR